MPDWLGEEWPTLYPIMPNPCRFPRRPGWGDEIKQGHSGVYFLVALRQDQNDEERRVIPRLLDFDATGTLYVGKADWNPTNQGNGLAARLGSLANAIRPDRNGANHALRILRETELYRQQFPALSLAICWKYHSRDDLPIHGEAAQLESAFMQRYIRRFGEAPPFNSQGSLTADGNAVTDQDPVV